MEMAWTRYVFVAVRRQGVDGAETWAATDFCTCIHAPYVQHLESIHSPVSAGPVVSVSSAGSARRKKCERLCCIIGLALLSLAKFKPRATASVDSDIQAKQSYEEHQTYSAGQPNSTITFLSHTWGESSLRSWAVRFIALEITVQHARPSETCGRPAWSWRARSEHRRNVIGRMESKHRLVDGLVHA